MGDQSAIEWTEATWNPIAGCSRVSEGCRNCYAERQAIRIPRYQDVIVRSTSSGPRWTGNLMLREEQLDQPLRWKRPRRIFVNSMSDLFHEQAPDEWIERIFGVMARAWWHTFQVLTKRPERMRAFLNRPWRTRARNCSGHWPLPNVWLGVSVEDQATFAERWGILRRVPAAVRFLSMEPLLGPIDLQTELWEDLGPFIWPDWAIIGGESGPGARPCHLRWIRDLKDQLGDAGIPTFIKQVGAEPFDETCGPGCEVGDGSTLHDPDSHRLNLRDRKGGDPTEWPEDLRIREYPR